LSTAKTLFLATVLAVASSPARGDGTLMSFHPAQIEGMTADRWERAKALKPPAILDRVRNATSWASCYEALLGASTKDGNRALLRALATEVSSSSGTKLDGTSGLIIWERIVTDDIFFVGKGLWVQDDLFRVAGRANWILRTVKEKSFGIVTPESSQAELDDLRGKWERFLAGESVAEIAPEFPSDAKGLEEIRSPTAIRALIRSLRPTPAKAAHVSRCLKTVYGLTELPASPDSQARFCSPDTYVHLYLAKVTPVADQHAAEWWEAWWQDHGAALQWDAAKATFVLPATAPATAPAPAIMPAP
jgi:hypothetical protein